MSRPAPALSVEYAEIDRKNMLWFACAATRDGDGTYHPDPMGETLMFFPTEEGLINYLDPEPRERGPRTRRIEARHFAKNHARWMKDREAEDIDSF
jgi:hypothetical protein